MPARDRHVVFLGPQNEPALPKSERDWVRPMNPYAVTKLATEQYILPCQRSHGLDTLAFQFFNVCGPRQRAGHVDAAVIPMFADARLRGKPLPNNGDGSDARDFTYVGTVCRVLLGAVERRVAYLEPINLAFALNTTLLELIEWLEVAANAAPRWSTAIPVRGTSGIRRPLRSIFTDAEQVSLHRSLAETLDWFKETS